MRGWLYVVFGLSALVALSSIYSLVAGDQRSLSGELDSSYDALCQTANIVVCMLLAVVCIGCAIPPFIAAGRPGYRQSAKLLNVAGYVLIVAGVLTVIGAAAMSSMTCADFAVEHDVATRLGAAVNLAMSAFVAYATLSANLKYAPRR